ncbi:MAG: transposase [Chitinivibrionales bacterium]|nr:transposase [Chitinivibrionales bacterium]
MLESWCGRTANSAGRESWHGAKAEVMVKGENPRFIVTNLPIDGFTMQQTGRFAPAACYEQFYCARGNMENRIKEQQLDLFADRTSTHFMESNQLRLYLATFAYVLMERFRSLALKGTQLAEATAATIRLKLLKIAASVRISCRRIYIRFVSAFPLKEVFALMHTRILGLARLIT